MLAASPKSGNSPLGCRAELHYRPALVLALQTKRANAVARNSLLPTDTHAGYHDLEFYGYAHERCNHCDEHFGPTNEIEHMWGVMKRYLKKLYGCILTSNLQLILNEWMARQNQPSWFASPQAYLKVTVCSGLVD